ncbi:MAG: ATP-binding protein [Lachnospirales bacterium]
MYEYLPDIPRLYTAFAEFFACLLYIIFYKKGKFSIKAIVKIIVMGIGQVFFQLTAALLPLEYWIITMLINLAWMLITIYVNTDLDVMFASYTSLKAFVLAEFIASLVWQFYTFFIWGTVYVKDTTLTVFVLICYNVILFAVYLIEKRQGTRNLSVDYDKKEIFVTAFITSIIFLMSNIGFLLTKTQYHLGNFAAIYFMRTTVNFCGLCIIYLLQIQKNDRFLKGELNKISNVLNSKQYDRYITYKENNELIQQKLHDLKHQVYIIKSEENSAVRNNKIDSIIEELSNISVNIDTGNAVLDTILTTKNTYCIEQKIIFSCIADGKLLNFMEVTDICSIFGNAFDNAIEYVMKEEKIEKRLINLRLGVKQNFIIIRFENYCEKIPNFEDGLPVTTKKDKVNHGYGLKSIKYIAEKYDGSMAVSYKDNWFTVNILIPKK